MIFEIKGLEQVQKNLSQLSKQLDYAMTLTLNDLAFDAQDSLRGEIKGGLNTRVNTSKAFAIKKAKKTNLTATISLKDDWHKDVIPQHYKGGIGARIKFEKEMMSRGYLGRNNSAVPLKKMGKKRYTTVLNSTRRGIRQHSKMFVIGTRDKSHLRPGVWQKNKRSPKLLIGFRREAEYKKRFNMYKTVEKVVNRRAKTYFYKNLQKALSTAR